MSDLALNVVWKEILKEAEAGKIPHCWAIAAPEEWHIEILEKLSGIILNNKNNKIDIKSGHPDLIIIGTLEKAANIEACRNLIQDIALKPVKSERRLGVILSADKLLLPAANSLLKLAEEPPSHANLLFLMEDERFFLKTLRSRSRFNILRSDERAEIKKIPETEAEWIEWLELTRKNIGNLDFIINDLESWVSFAVSQKNFILADKIERLRIIASEKNLSVPMICDVIILSLKEDYKYFENIFSDIR